MFWLKEGMFHPDTIIEILALDVELKYNDFLVHFLGQVNQGYPYENVEMKNGSNERLLPELWGYKVGRRHNVPPH